MNLPPYISRTPPPLNDTEDDEDEEFGTFAICSDLGDEVCSAFEKTSHVIKSEDNVSEDSGFCMNSLGQTQSPCDISPLSSSFSKGNECIALDNHGDIVLNSSTKESETCKADNIKLDHSSDHTTFTQNFDGLHGIGVSSDSYKSVEMPVLSETFQNKCVFSKKSDIDVDKVYFVNESASVINVLSDDVISEPDSNGQDSTEFEGSKTTNFNKVIRHKTIEETTCLEKNSTIIEQSKILSNNKLLNQELLESQENTYLVKNNFTVVQSPVTSTISCIENSSQYYSHERESALVDDWNSEDEEFSDFTGFQLAHSLPEILNCDKKFQVEVSETFQDDLTRCKSGTLQSAIGSSCVWESLQCFEETPAFKYKWSTSITQMKFLQALQIDSRNILYGPWNKMNKCSWVDVTSSFDSHINTYSVNCNVTSIIIKNKEMIPDAHFDWITSGLINPLQGTNDKEIVQNLEENSLSEISMTRSRDILNSLPKLNFLKSTYINFK